jgi:hypothetical protein
MPKNRPYTVIESYFSLSYDVSCKKQYTINGYAQLWQWDRKKVRTFVNGMLSGEAQKLGHLKDTKGAGKGTLIPHEIRFIFNNLEGQKDTYSPLSPHLFPTISPTTKDPNPNPNKKAFVPPSVEEVTEYCLSRENKVSPHKWHDFYSAKGWMVGKNKMKDWQAAVRTWEEPKGKTKKIMNMDGEWCEVPV